MIAICPAGPPKLMKPSRSQKRKASAKLTGPGAAGPAAGVAGPVVEVVVVIQSVLTAGVA
jgi:hypothetical protein